MTYAIALAMLALSISLLVGLWIGWYLRDIKNWMDKTTQFIVDKLSPKSEPAEPASTGAIIIDPNDPIQRAKYEREEMMRKLNQRQED